MGMGGMSEGRSLNQTPTWAVAGVSAVIILISIVLEKGLHALGTLLKKKHKTALYEALDKIKGELMVLGFISLLLTFVQGYLSRVCVPSSVADTMLPCLLENPNSSDHITDRRLLRIGGRILASTSSSEHQCKNGYEPLITVEAAHQLHILIFFLAVFHVFYSAMTMMLGKLKIRGWKNWERETLSADYESSNGSINKRFTHATTFVKQHNSCWAKLPFFFYVGCFYRQFFKSVDRSDYVTLRNGFITAHIAPGGKFNFQKYIKRSLEDDFKVVVGVSPILWTSFVIFLFLNVNGWHTLLWASLLPLIVILAIGTKLQCILTNMALEITDRSSVVQGIPLVQGSDTYFWLSKPQLVLHLLHFTLFQNAFQITYLLWILYEFGSKSCFHVHLMFELTKIAMGLGVMVLCSYSTLPLYALVTQMGSNVKNNIFDEQTTKALKRWRKDIKKKGENSKTPVKTLGEGNSKSLRSSSRRYSSGPILHRFMSMGRLSRTSDYSTYDELVEDCDHDDMERSLSGNLIVRVDNNLGENEMTTLGIVGEITEEDHPQIAKS